MAEYAPEVGSCQHIPRENLLPVLMRQSLCLGRAWSERLHPASPQTEATAIGGLSAPALTLDTRSRRLCDHNTALTTTGSTWVGVHVASPATIGTGLWRIVSTRLAHVHLPPEVVVPPLMVRRRLARRPRVGARGWPGRRRQPPPPLLVPPHRSAAVAPPWPHPARSAWHRKRRSGHAGVPA